MVADASIEAAAPLEGSTGDPMEGGGPCGCTDVNAMSMVAGDVVAKDASEDADADLQPDELASIVQTAMAQQLNGDPNQLVQDVPDLAAGQMRLTGNFQGVATTHTHQLDLTMGLDVEMPSEMAAEAMKQLAHRSRSPSRGRAALRNESPAAEPRSIWNSLHSFFRRDALQQQAVDRRRRSPSMSLRLKDQVKENKELVSSLEETQGQATKYEAELLALEGEKLGLLSQIELLQQELSEQALHIEELRMQSDQHLEGAGVTSAQMAERDAQIRDLEQKLSESTRRIDEREASLAAERDRCKHLQEATKATLDEVGVIEARNTSLTSQVEVLEVQVAGLTGQVNVLQAENERLSGLHQQQAAVVDEASAAERRELEAASRQRDEALAECARLTAAMQEAEAAEAESRRGLVLQVKEITEQALSAETLKNTLSREADQLKSDVNQLHEQLEASEQARQNLAVDNHQLVTRLSQESASAQDLLRRLQTAEDELQAVRSEGEGSGSAQRTLEIHGQSQEGKLVDELQVQLQALREERDRTEKERVSLAAERDAATQRATQQREKSQQVRGELDALKLEQARDRAAVSVAEARSASLERNLVKTQAEIKDMQSKFRESTNCEEKLKQDVLEKKREVEDLQRKLFRSQQDGMKLASEKAELQSKAAYHEEASSQAQARLLETSKKEAVARSEAGDAKREHTNMTKILENQVKVLEMRLEASEKVAAEERQRADAISQERDKLSRDVRDQRQNEIANTSKLKKDLHDARERELQSQAANNVLEAQLQMQGLTGSDSSVDITGQLQPLQVDKLESTSSFTPRVQSSTLQSPPATSGMLRSPPGTTGTLKSPPSASILQSPVGTLQCSPVAVAVPVLRAQSPVTSGVPTVTATAAAPARTVQVSRSVPMLQIPSTAAQASPVPAMASPPPVTSAHIVQTPRVTSVRVSQPVRRPMPQVVTPMQGTVTVQVTGIRRIVR